MADPIISPDGKWMWTGTEWIPAPPSSHSGAQSTINLQDSGVHGDVKIEQNTPNASSTINFRDSKVEGEIDLGQNSIGASSTINLKDSAIGGDFNITQNNAGDIAAAMIQALTHMGIDPHTHAKETNFVQNGEVQTEDKNLESAEAEGAETGGWEAMVLGNAAFDSKELEEARVHYSNAFDIFIEQQEDFGLGMACIGNGNVFYEGGDLDAARQLYEMSRDFLRNAEYTEREGYLLGKIGAIKLKQGLLDEAENDLTQSLSILRDTYPEKKAQQSSRLWLLAKVNEHKNDLASAVALLEESLALDIEIEDAEGQSTVHYKLGQIQDKRGLFRTAEEHYMASLAIDRELGDTGGEAVCLTSLSALFVRMANILVERTNEEVED